MPRVISLEESHLRDIAMHITDVRQMLSVLSDEERIIESALNRLSLLQDMLTAMLSKPPNLEDKAQDGPRSKRVTEPLRSRHIRALAHVGDDVTTPEGYAALDTLPASE